MLGNNQELLCQGVNHTGVAIVPEKTESGFSLMEMLVGIAVIGILAAVAIPGFSVWLPE
jgi:prepilin-type N-terminal cleavage/methylation domain-containing protein